MNSDLGVSSVLEDIDELFGSFSDDKLGTVSALARSQLRLHEQVLASDAETKRLKEELRAIQEDRVRLAQC